MATYYIDFNNTSATLSGTWAWTNTMTAVTGTGGAATTELSVGKYVAFSLSAARSGWYKVTAITNDSSFTVLTNIAEVTTSGVSMVYNHASGLTTNSAFCHPIQWKELQTQSSGDIGYVRGGQTWCFGTDNVNPFEASGSELSPISLIGDETGSIFGDTSPGRPQFRWQLGRIVRLTLNNDFITLKGFRLGDVYASGDARQRQFSFSGGDGIRVENIIMTGSGVGGDAEIITVSNAKQSIFFKNCAFASTSLSADMINIGNLGRGVTGISTFDNCNFYNISGICVSGAGGGGATIYMNSCAFGYNTGGTLSAVTAAIRVSGMNFFLRDSLFNSTSANILGLNTSDNGRVFIENFNSIKNDNRQYFPNAVVHRDTTIVRSGGGDSSSRVSPTAICTSNRTFTFQEFPYEIPLLLYANTTYTVSLYVYATGWTVVPLSNQCYMRVAYYTADSARRAILVSTDSIVSQATWTQLSVKTSINSTDLVYCSIVLATSSGTAKGANVVGTGGEIIYIDPVPTAV